MAHVAVIGGGMAGLTAAHRLQQAGVDVTLYEAAHRPGGVVGTESVDGFLVETGPNTLRAATPALEALLRDLSLYDRRLPASPAAKHRYVVQGGSLVAVPSSPPAFIRSPLFPVGAKLRLLCEPFVPAAPPTQEESVAGFVRRRLGAAFVDYAVEPFVAGVYAGDPEQLSIRHAFPRLHALEQTHGSLLRGQLHRARRRKDSGHPASGGEIFSFPGGLAELPGRLAERLGGAVRLNTRVTELTRDGRRWVVRAEQGDDRHEGNYDAALVTLPLHHLAEMPLGVAFDRVVLRAVPYAPVSVLALGYTREAVRHPLDGFGVLVPRAERAFSILGVVFSSTLFPGRAPDGHVLLTVMVGGQRRPDLARAADGAVEAVVRDDLARLLGVREAPVFTRRYDWPHAIPQYNLGYGGALREMERLESAAPGLYLAGNYRGGVSVGDTVASSAAQADRVLAYLNS